MGEDAEDPDQSEYLARVRWINTRDREDAVSEKGMFANQNVVAKRRQRFAQHPTCPTRPLEQRRTSRALRGL